MTNQCSCTKDQLDARKVEILFNALKYFNIKHYIRKQPLKFTYQAWLDKCKVHKKSLQQSMVHLHSTQNSITTTTKTNTIAAVKYKANKAITPARNIDHPINYLLTHTRTTMRPATDVTSCIK